MFLIGIAAGALQAAWHYTLIRTRPREGCFTAFRLNPLAALDAVAGAALGLALR